MHYVTEDTEADKQAEIEVKLDTIWISYPELVIEEAGGAMWLLNEYMVTLDGAWLKIRLEDACERLAAKS